MTLVLNVHRLIALRGIRHPRAFLVNHGYTDNEARKLLSGKSATLAHKMTQRLCETFHCTPNDIYDWVGPMDHPLAALKKPSLPDVREILDSKSPEEIAEILRKLQCGEI